MAFTRFDAGSSDVGRLELEPSLHILPAKPGRTRFPSSEAEEVAGQRRLEQDLRRAFAQEDLQVHYQPRVSLSTGRIVGAEALLRWQHPRRGMVSPASFIPVAERCGLITEIGGWVMVAASMEAAQWPRDVSVSVNVSAKQLVDGSLLQQVSAALSRSGLAAHRLELELTESMLVDCNIENLLTLSALRDMGVGIAMDDFGTGYAGLAALKQLPLTALKLDRSLIKGMFEEPENSVIVRALVEIGHSLGLKVVAEGIETEEERDFLEKIGCNEGQAYLFGRPVPGNLVRERLARDS